VYGLNTAIRNHMKVIGDRVFYLAGYNIVAYNFRERNQQYYAGQEGYQGFSAIEISGPKKQIAMGLLSSEGKPAILIQELGHSSSKRRKLEFP
jgi:cilia- and flagella-associated protein 57